MIDLLRHYLKLEKIMLKLDKLHNPIADELRDTMDDVWHELSNKDVKFLNNRNKVDMEHI